jgi:malyl-CoA/(S)-citramalyl-CoA lyase
MAVKNRLHRSELAVPGSNKRMLEKAPDAGADVVFLDLEDAVAPDDKAQARLNIIDALNTFDWSKCAVSIRMNGLDTHYAYRDLVDIVEACGDIDTQSRFRSRCVFRVDPAIANRGSQGL